MGECKGWYRACATRAAHFNIFRCLRCNQKMIRCREGEKGLFSPRMDALIAVGSRLFFIRYFR